MVNYSYFYPVALYWSTHIRIGIAMKQLHPSLAGALVDSYPIAAGSGKYLGLLLAQ